MSPCKAPLSSVTSGRLISRTDGLLVARPNGAAQDWWANCKQKNAWSDFAGAVSVSAPFGDCSSVS